MPGGKGPARVRSWQVEAPAGPRVRTILFIPFPDVPDKLPAEAQQADAAWTEVILRRCPFCQRDSIRGHGRRSKQAHDEIHDRIPIRRGLCSICHTPFTFLPWFSLPYAHYSLLARLQTLRLRFQEGRTWERSAPAVKDPDRVAAPATLRRWRRQLDSSQPPFRRLRETVLEVLPRLARGAALRCGALPWSPAALAACLQRFWPLRL